MYMHLYGGMCMSIWGPMRPEEEFESPGIGVTGSCGLPNVDAEN